MAGPTKDELLAELKKRGVEASPRLTNDELQSLLDEYERNEQAHAHLGEVVKYALTEEDARDYNRERDGLTRFLKASMGRPLPAIRVKPGDVVPVIVNAVTGDGALCGNAQMPGGGVLWVEGFEPYEEA